MVILVLHVLSNVKIVIALILTVLFVLLTESIYQLVLVQLIIMKLLVLLNVLLVQVLVLFVLLQVNVACAITDTSYMTHNAQQPVQMDTIHKLLLTNVIHVIVLVLLVMELTITIVKLVKLHCSSITINVSLLVQLVTLLIKVVDVAELVMHHVLHVTDSQMETVNHVTLVISSKEKLVSLNVTLLNSQINQQELVILVMQLV
jgi:hypothetical protein